MAVHGIAGPQVVDTLVDQYFHDIQDSTGLSAEEEAEVAARIQLGDEEAFQRLVKANLRFVVSVAKQYQNQGLPLSDLIDEGNLGLMVAARRFDGTRGFKFISYAVWWIRQAILQALAEQSRTVRLPLNRIGQLTRLSKASGRLQQKLGRAPEPEELAEELEVDAEDMDMLARMAQRPVPLDAPCDETEPDRTFGDLLVDESQPDPEQELADDELKREIKAALKHLNEAEARVLRMYYGLDGNPPMTLEEIGAYVGRTRERVRQIKEKALQKLRHPNRSDPLADASGRATRFSGHDYGGNGRLGPGNGQAKPGNGKPKAPQGKKLVEKDKADFVFMMTDALRSTLGRDPGVDEIAIESDGWVTEEEVCFVHTHPELYA